MKKYGRLTREVSSADTGKGKADNQENKRDNVDGDSCVANQIVDRAEDVLYDVEVGGWVEKLGAPSEKSELQVFEYEQNDDEDEAEFILVYHA